MKTAVIYARYSSDSQTEQSIEGQMRICEEYAKKNNIVILDKYIDRAMTGTNDNRPDFQRMIKDSARREWNYVLVYKLDRFSRNKYETAIHKKTLRDNGVKVLSAMENIPDTPEGIILESLLEGMNQYFSAELSQKVKRGMRETRIKGLYQGGGLPYGYKAVGRKVVVDETKADTVRFIFRQYANGYYVREIADELTARNILYRGKPFVLNTVYNILKNQKYSGVYMHEDEVVDNIYPRIVAPELYETVRKKIEANRYGKRSLEADYLLRRKVRCGYCGGNIIAETGTGKDGTVRRYYKCAGKKRNKGSCNKAQIRKALLEDLVVNAIILELNKPEIMDAIVAELMRLQNEEEPINVELAMLMSEKAGVDKSIENIITAIENGIVANSAVKRLQDLEKRQDELEKQILLEKRKRKREVSESDIRAFYNDALKAEPRTLVNLLVEEIVLYDDKIEIYYKNPANIGPDDKRGFFVCSEKFGASSSTASNATRKCDVTVSMYLR